MTDKEGGFRSEAEMVERGRRLINRALRGLQREVLTRYEVSAPGGVPDLVIFSNERKALQYVITVEFKLSAWQKAITQAFRHRNFANEVYVVIDHAKSASALRHLDVFKKANVGLVSVDTDDKVRIWHYAKPALPFSSKFSREMARALLCPCRTLPSDLPFIRSVRGGLGLSGLRAAWGSPHPAP